MNKATVAVIAGTGVDTEMGVGVLAAKGLAALSFPVSQEAREQTLLQIMPAEQKKEKIRAILREIKSQGVEKVFVYCNSLSGAVPMPELAVEEDMKIVTPLDGYALIAARYKRLAVLAANCQGLAGIERTILQVNPQADVFSAAALPLVLAVEDGMEPNKLVESFFLAKLMDYFAANGAEAVILGCTHFPYFREALAKKTTLDLIDPADIMLELLLR